MILNIILRKLPSHRGEDSVMETRADKPYQAMKNKDIDQLVELQS